LRGRSQRIGGHGAAEGDTGGQAPAADIGVGDQGGVGRHPGQSEADAPADAHREKEQRQRRSQTAQGHPEGHEPEADADE
jgi:hypothetical protein